jgi:hypothetical protein
MDWLCRFLAFGFRVDWSLFYLLWRNVFNRLSNNLIDMQQSNLIPNQLNDLLGDCFFAAECSAGDHYFKTL